MTRLTSKNNCYQSANYTLLPEYGGGSSIASSPPPHPVVSPWDKPAVLTTSDTRLEASQGGRDEGFSDAASWAWSSECALTTAAATMSARAALIVCTDDAERAVRYDVASVGAAYADAAPVVVVLAEPGEPLSEGPV